MALNKVTYCAFMLAMLSTDVMATSYVLPPAHQSIIGNKQTRSVGTNETITSIAEKYDLGFNALEKANPFINLNKPIATNKKLTLPTTHLLPNVPRKGIVVNLPEMRMYYYLGDGATVVTYPIGIGKIGKTIPEKEAIITKKVKDPIWVPTEDIRQFNLAQGIVLPQIMPPGPDNPLGPYAIYMSIPTFLMHSTIYPESIGKRASFGCIRMYQSDIEQLFPAIDKGISVVIINSPTKVAWQGKHLYMEAHTPLEESQQSVDGSLASTVRQIGKASMQHPVLIDWQAVAFIEEERDGMPHEIGMKI